MFFSERQALNTEYQAAQNLWTGAIAGMLICLAAPTILAEVMPKQAKTLFLASGLAFAGASACTATRLNAGTRRHHKAMERSAEMVIEKEIAAKATLNEAIQVIDQESEMMRLLYMMPPETQAHWAAKLTQLGYLSPMPQPAAIPVQSQVVPNRVQMAPAQGGAIAYAQPQQAITHQPQHIGKASAAPDLMAIADPIQRMKTLLQAMANDGFPLGTLLNHPFVWCWGRSQSGKTTVALMLAIARQVMGHNVSYFTTDDDYPRNLPWENVADTPDEYAVALESVRKIISGAGKGTLAGNTWIFDEMLAATAEHELDIQPLLICVLMKLAKTKGCAIAISQADTSSAHGIKGLDAAWREERVSLGAIHTEDAMGNRQPSGAYAVAQGGSTEEWRIPEWMYTDANQWGVPDPAQWMINRFPELSGQAAQTVESQVIDTEIDDVNIYQQLRAMQDLKLATTGQGMTDAELQQSYFELTGGEENNGLLVDEVNLQYLWTVINESPKEEEPKAPTAQTND